MTTRTRKTYSPEFRLEVAQLVVDQGYSIREAASAMDVAKSNVDKWVRQLKDEHKGIAKSPQCADPRSTKDQRARKENQAH